MADNTPLNCPKGYGICWGCKVHCDHPQAHILNKKAEEGSCYDPDEYREPDYYERFEL
jgi:hypothetical protein